MITKTIKYDDLDGNQIEGVFYFHITREEAIAMELKFPGGLDGHIRRIGQDDTKNAEVYQLFKDILIEAHGQKADDNIRFLKSPEIRSRFADSDALGSLIIELMRDEEGGAKFLEECLPARQLKEARADIARAKASGGAVSDNILDTEREITMSEALGTDTEKLKDKAKRLKKYDATHIAGLSEVELDDFEDTVKTRNMTPEQLRAAMKRREELRANPS